MSKDFLGDRAVIDAKNRVVVAVYDVRAAASHLSRWRLRRFGHGVPRAVRRLREVCYPPSAHPSPAAIEVAARELNTVVDWGRVDLTGEPARDFAAALTALGSRLKALDEARRKARR